MSIAQVRDYEQLKLSLDIETLVKQLLPHGKGYPEWKSLNPTRDDKKIGSFQVNLKTGMWIDFATDEGGDILDLYSYIKNCTITETYDLLKNNIQLNNIPLEKKPKTKKRPQSRLIYPPPPDAFEPIILKDDGRWCYLDAYANPLMYVTRHNLSNGGKYFTPHTYRQQETGLAYWDTMAQGLEVWPLYNLNVLHIFNTSRVLIVEGESTACAAGLILTDWVITTWHGGAGAVNRIDLEPLRGRDVCLWPDNDEPGIKAMNTLAERLQDIASKVQVIVLPREQLAIGWDLADGLKQGITKDDVMELIDNKPVLIEEKKEFQYPLMSDSKKPFPLDVTENLKYLLDYYKISVRWNMMKRLRDVSVPGVKFYNEESENASLTYIINLAVKNYFNIRRVDKHLDQISWDNLYHPVREWILSKPLTKKSIFNDFLNTIQTTNNNLSYILIKRWMLSAVYALFSDNNFCAQGVLVLQGETGTHKSSFIMSLAPESMRAIKGGLSLDPAKKDDIFTSSEYWIAELGELDATFRKADIARLKSHITNDIDDVRRPHAVRNSKMIRRTVYAATVNESRFLVDTTGNRRWWTVSVTEPINTRHGLDMQQIWREIYEMYLMGESPTLLEHEMKQLNDINKEFEFLDPFEEKLEMHFDWDCPDRQLMTSTQVLADIGYDKPSKSETTRMGILLKNKNIPRGTGRGRNSFYLPRSNFVKK